MEPIPALWAAGLLCVLAAADPADTSSARLVAVDVAPCYPAPSPGTLPSSYRNKGDTCTAVRIEVDSSGMPWFELLCDTSKLWSPARSWRYVSAAGEETTHAREQNDADRKRRLRILQEHRDWPRRIVRAVRDGTVCLDMTAEQLEAAWGEPKQRSAAFAIGLGNHDTWFYTEKDGIFLMVALKNGRVIGWTLSAK